MTQCFYFSISEVSPPLLILHAEDDYIVPFHLGEKVRNISVINLSRKHSVNIAGHNNL